jgi:hypothetical protein
VHDLPGRGHVLHAPELDPLDVADDGRPERHALTGPVALCGVAAALEQRLDQV